MHEFELDMGNRKIKYSIAHLFLTGFVFALVLVIGCATSEESRNTMPIKDINTVMEAHTEELMAIKGVVGVAIGENEEKKPCIMILVLEATDEILDKLPKEIEGHPVCPFESGEIKPLTSN